MADVRSSAENNGTAMNKVADLFVRLGQRGIIWAVILMMKTRPQANMRKNFGNIASRKTCFGRNNSLESCANRGKTRGSAIRLAQTRSCRAHENESLTPVSAWKS
jgi:hypothetical protein